MIINSNFTLTYGADVAAVAKLVNQYIESGELRDRFSIFDGEDVPFGVGYERSLIFAAKKQATPSNTIAHGNFPPTGFSLIFSQKYSDQYAVTIDYRRIRECMHNEALLRAYAAELTESLYQGAVDDKNGYVYGAINTLLTSPTATATITLTAGQEEQYAIDMLTAIKSTVEDFREGVTGTSYGNTTVGASRLSASRVAIVMSNAFSAFLDSNGYAKVFTPEYLRASGVERVTTNRMADNTVLVTDGRNIQVHRINEELVRIPQPRGGENLFYNVDRYVEAAKVASGAVAYPYKVLLTEEGE